ncbi:MAG: NAD(P)-dependent glycerol-3-phosphate dehydrogenase [Verrucomicrobiota bacterium]|nr:NAD(P)-dependent glycerol-3-phosphate dehydrogenase [Verrucomicrobiota bacterium]
MSRKKIACLGAGTWGFTLACLLGHKGHEVYCWARDPLLVARLQKERSHPKLADSNAPASVHFTGSLDVALSGVECLVESVTASGIRPVFQEIASRTNVPVVLTSKGIERGTGLLLPELVSEIYKGPVGILSGPSHAEEVISQLPTSVVCSAYDTEWMQEIHELFVTPAFRVYPNTDIAGVAFGGAMKNIIAIASGIADGLGSGDNAKAALLTRGLHEMRKLSVAKNARPETLNGLSGLGDLVVTCMSRYSRNYRLGKLLAEGYSPEGARQKIGMAVEGIYTCAAARDLGRAHNIPIPITEGTYAILYEGLDPRVAVQTLLQRAIKQEHL